MESDELDSLRTMLESLPEQVLAATGSSGRDWPEPGQSAPAMPEVGGASASQFEPVVARLERVAAALESLSDERAAGWGGGMGGKLIDMNNARNLWAAMPVPQALGLASQSWAMPASDPSPPSWRGDGFHDSERWGQPAAPQSPPAPAGSSPSPPPASPASAAGDEEILPWFPDAVPTRLAGGRPTMLAPGSPGPAPGPSASAGGIGDAQASLVAVLEQLRQEIAGLRQELSGQPAIAGGATAPASPWAAISPPASSTGPAGPAATTGAFPEVVPGTTAFPRAASAHEGGAATPWDAALARVRG